MINPQSAEKRTKKAHQRLRSRFDLAGWRRPFVNAKQLASYLEVDQRTIARMVDNRELPGEKIGRRYKIPTALVRRRFHVETA